MHGVERSRLGMTYYYKAGEFKEDDGTPVVRFAWSNGRCCPDCGSKFFEAVYHPTRIWRCAGCSTVFDDPVKYGDVANPVRLVPQPEDGKHHVTPPAVGRESETGRVWAWTDGYCCSTCGSVEFKEHPTGHTYNYGYHCSGCSAVFIDPELFGVAGEKLHGFYVRALQAMDEQGEKNQGVTPEGID